jgi:hypothetical protein
MESVLASLKVIIFIISICLLVPHTSRHASASSINGAQAMATTNH